MVSLTAWLVRRATVLLAGGVFAGLVAPDLASALRPLLTPAVWGLLLLALLRLDWRAIGDAGKRPLTVGLVVAWLLVASPILMVGAVAGLDLPAGLATALVLMAAAPPIVSSPAIAMILGLDAALALVVMGAATLVSPLVLPATTLMLLGLPLDVSVGDLMLQLGVFLGSALAVAALVRGWAGPARVAAAANAIDVGAIALLIVFAIAIMDGVTDRLLAEPAWVLAVTGAAFAANISLQAVSAGSFAVFGRHRSLTTGFLGGNRNMALLLAVLPADVHPDVLLCFALGQIPIYVLPALLAPVYRRLLGGAQPP